ncbi:uncharacterized protein LOC105691653 [Athalia rosae]|uniref:uncharacterized protein LOC105691653 n=1 Tax=Athalia rosae TaxID=37344 RepID=UPI00203396A9|nr:uncharacterized protein LOC105691653 [Athalia rosae]
MSSLPALLVAVVASISGIISGAEINQLDIPDVIRNGTGPVTLSCVYDLTGSDNGLVIKWFHDEAELIYQWIPPMSPQDIGVIKGLTEYPEDAVSRPKSHSIIRLKEVTLAMSGNYTCSVSTFEEEDIKTKRMIVYAPESNATVFVTPPSSKDGPITLVCAVHGAWPRPGLTFLVDGVPVEGQFTVYPANLEEYQNQGSWVRYEATIEEPLTPVRVNCEINIPFTNYRRQEGIVYYPSSHRSTAPVDNENASSPHCASKFLEPIVSRAAETVTTNPENKVSEAQSSSFSVFPNSSSHSTSADNATGHLVHTVTTQSPDSPRSSRPTEPIPTQIIAD